MTEANLSLVIFKLLKQGVQMHNIQVRQEILDRVMARRGRVNFFEEMAPSQTALVVIDMQNTFCAKGSPAEVAPSRGIVPNINALTPQLRSVGVPVIWVLHANTQHAGKSDWDLFYNHVVAGEVRSRTLVSNAPENQAIYSELEAEDNDIVIVKNRYSALIPGSSSLERVLRSMGVNTILVAGTKTNICCESTARDAMMMDFKVAMLSDCCAALSDEEHRAALENIIQQFGNVMTGEEALRMLKSN
ncbi:isochorismatase family cysteine hydrolase [Pandoraea sp.]|uniref:isochorismatase family protein n=1 Tax=Pandoraea sp. TaxID=1883445 RepID=UPI0025ED5853|nr:isochorismatase family cysteine hydrolase [Pandoraea sp.]